MINITHMINISLKSLLTYKFLQWTLRYPILIPSCEGLIAPALLSNIPADYIQLLVPSGIASDAEPSHPKPYPRPHLLWKAHFWQFINKEE